MYVTKHGEQRMKERCGIPRKAHSRMADKILEEGIDWRQATGELYKWCENYQSKNSESKILLYGDKAYIFCSGKLITVLQVPPKFVKRIKKLKGDKDGSREG